MLSNQEQKERKSRIIALAGTILLHALVCLVLLRLALQKPSTFLPEEGIEVDLSYNGANDPFGDSVMMSQYRNADSIKALEISESPEVVVTEKADRALEGKQTGNTAIKARTIIETPLARIVNPKPAKPAGNIKPAEKSLQANTVKPGETGKPNQAPPPTVKNADYKTYTIMVQLGERKAVSLAQPTFSPGNEGRIVVSIIVNQEGKVVYASSATKGTTIQDIKVRMQAEDAARKSVFAPDPQAANEQKGLITFNLSKSK